ncbi:MAG TPA: hypothetical protein PK289_10710 [Bacteroidia bacterium]|jgi:hypothetical protein|nr:hypothetical protein [Bacteroidia bacterium]HRG51252.1 hypothetical protein [Bacteroidia bacterium]
MFNKDQQLAIQNLRPVKKYFERNCEGDFQPEHETTSKIINFIIAAQSFTDEDLKNIAAWYNEIISQKHANGSGWLDFKKQLTHFFKQFSYKVKWDKATDELTITKMKER